jgi:hypothetical protein
MLEAGKVIHDSGIEKGGDIWIDED